jgi:beta-lactamase superfamily II metal-dependent hydrolase
VGRDRVRRKLAVLDVGHGNCAVLQDLNGVVVIDAGPGNALEIFLREQEIRRIDVVLISHADQDHLGGLISLLSSRAVEIGRVRLNTDSLKGSKIWDDLLYELAQLDQKNELDFQPYLTREEKGVYDQGSVEIRVLAPSKYVAGKGPGSKDRKGRRIRSNTLSAVIQLSEGGKPIALFPGDLDVVGLENLDCLPEDLRAPLLVFPHHGGRVGGGALDDFVRQLCEKVKPDVVVFSISRGRYGSALPEVVSAVRKYVEGVWIACTQMSEHCASELPKARPTHLNREFAQGREGSKCCAGTLVIDLDEDKGLLPIYGDHQEFITLAAPSALCRRTPLIQGPS